MSRPADDNEVTESVDLLIPSVGEIVGGSMREWDMEKLRANYKANELEEDDYAWYNDQVSESMMIILVTICLHCADRRCVCI